MNKAGLSPHQNSAPANFSQFIALVGGRGRGDDAGTRGRNVSLALNEVQGQCLPKQPSLVNIRYLWWCSDTILLKSHTAKWLRMPLKGEDLVGTSCFSVSIFF